MQTSSETRILTPDQINAIVSKVKTDKASSGSDTSVSISELNQLVATATSLSQENADAKSELAIANSKIKELESQKAELENTVRQLQQEVGELTTLRQEIAAQAAKIEQLTLSNAELEAKIKAQERVAAVREKFMTLRSKAETLRIREGLTAAKFNEFFGKTEEAAQPLLVMHIKGEARPSLENLEFFLEQLRPNSLYPNVAREDVDIFPHPGDDAPLSDEEALVEAAINDVIKQNYGKQDSEKENPKTGF